jgi:hypothetical protein
MAGRGEISEDLEEEGSSWGEEDEDLGDGLEEAKGAFEAGWGLLVSARVGGCVGVLQASVENLMNWSMVLAMLGGMLCLLLIDRERGLSSAQIQW